MTVSMKELGGFLIGLAVLAVGAVQVQQHQTPEPPTQHSEIRDVIPEPPEQRQVQLGQTRLHMDW